MRPPAGPRDAVRPGPRAGETISPEQNQFTITPRATAAQRRPTQPIPHPRRPSPRWTAPPHLSPPRTKPAQPGVNGHDTNTARTPDANRPLSGHQLPARHRPQLDTTPQRQNPPHEPRPVGRPRPALPIDQRRPADTSSPRHLSLTTPRHATLTQPPQRHHQTPHLEHIPTFPRLPNHQHTHPLPTPINDDHSQTKHTRPSDQIRQPGILLAPLPILHRRHRHTQQHSQPPLRQITTFTPSRLQHTDQPSQLVANPRLIHTQQTAYPPNSSRVPPALTPCGHQAEPAGGRPAHANRAKPRQPPAGQTRPSRLTFTAGCVHTYRA